MPNFQLFEKGDVNGEKEQKFYTFLKVRVDDLEEALPSCSAQPTGMSWHWFSSPMRGLGRLMVPLAYGRDKTGPTGSYNLSVSTESRVLVPKLGPSLSARQFSPWKGGEVRRSPKSD